MAARPSTDLANDLPVVDFLYFRQGDNRCDEKAGLQPDALSSHVIDALEAREIEETIRNS
jgi:hypothetical protein